MSETRRARVLRWLPALGAVASLAAGVLPPAPADAVNPGDPTAQEGFGAGMSAWTATDAGASKWTTTLDAASPSVEKKVLTSTDAQAGAHAAHWTGVQLGGAFRASARIKGNGAGAWAGLTFRYDPATGGYLVARYQSGGNLVQIVRYPGGTILAERSLQTTPGGCGTPPPAQVPAGTYFSAEVEQDAAGRVTARLDGVEVIALPLGAADASGGSAGVYYAGSPAFFEDFTVQGPGVTGDSHAAVSVNAAAPGATLPEGFLGAMMIWYASGNGMDANIYSWDELRENLVALQTVLPQVADLGLQSLRFPGGQVTNNYDWKKHVGDFYGDRYELGYQGGLTLDDFMQIAENLGAKPIITVNASDTPYGYGTFDGAREAADLVEYLTSPANGANPDPDGLAASDPLNVDWAKVRADNGHAEPYDVLGFEIGNELRGPPFLNGTPYAAAYAARAAEFAGAMKAVNPAVKIGIVGADSPTRSDFDPWYADVESYLSTANCDWRPADGVAAACGDAWIRHVLVPGLSSPVPTAEGVAFDGQGQFLERTFEVKTAGQYKLAISAYASGAAGAWPLLEANIDGGAALAHVYDIRNNGTDPNPAWPAMMLYRTPAVTLSAGTHTLRLTRQNNGIVGNRKLTLYPVVALEKAANPADFSRIDLRDTDVLSRVLQATANAYSPYALEPEPNPPGRIYDWPVWATEFYFTYEEFQPQDETRTLDQYVSPMDPTVYHLREAVADANLYVDFLNQGYANLTALQLFEDERGSGLIEGVALDHRHGDEIGLQRAGTANPPRTRPRGLLLGEMARHWKGRKLPVSVASPAYNVPGNAVDGISMGSTGFLPVSGVPYVTAVSALDQSGNKLYLTLVNKHLTQTMLADVTLSGFARGGAIAQTTVGGEGPWANNEPEADVCSHPSGTSAPCALGVETRRTTLFATGTDLTVAVPPTSIVFLAIPKANTDQTPPPAPVNLTAATSSDGTGVQLSWGSGGGEFVAYNVYRSALFEPGNPATEEQSDVSALPCAGPWSYKLNVSPFAQTGFVDREIDGGKVYCYGVRATDLAGNDGPMATLRRRATTQVRPLASILNVNTTVNPVLYGTTLAAVNEDEPGTPGSDFLMIRPRYNGIFPTSDLDFSIESAPFTGNAARLKSLRIVYASRVKTPLGVAQASVYLKNHAKGGVWERMRTFQEGTNYTKDQLLIRTASPRDYLSSTGRIAVRVATNEGAAYSEFHLEHLRFELETL